MHTELRHAGCALNRIYQLRKTKTNIQILQQNVLLKQKYMVTFLRQHGPEVFHEMRSAYVETLSRVLSSHFRSYLAALERLQVSALLTGSEIGLLRVKKGDVEVHTSCLRSCPATLGRLPVLLLSLDRPMIFARDHAHLYKYAVSRTGCLVAVVAAKALQCLHPGASAAL